MSSPKRPAPPAPDPNWELELHGPPPAAKRPPPESRDDLLAHAVLREPEPLDLFDDFKDLERVEVERVEVERVTVPPPAGMADHVARMMAEAALLDDEDEGDRPTPLLEIDTVEIAVPPRPAMRPPGTMGPQTAPSRSVPMGSQAAPKPAPRATEPQPRPAAAPPRGAAVKAVAREPEPLRTSSPLPFEAVRPPEPAAKRAVTPPPFGAVRPAERTQAIRARAPARTPTPAPMRAPTPAPFAIRPARPVQEERRISSLDLDDLPAVFALDGLSLDEPEGDADATREVVAHPTREVVARPDVASGSPRAASGSSPRAASGSSSRASPPSSDPVISPSLALPPSSAPAISPPFASLDADELFDELAWGAPPSAPAPARPPEPPPAPPPAPPNEPKPETIAAINARLAAGDYGRALVLAEAALEEHPDHPALVSSADMCRDELYQRYLERLGAADHVPRLAVNSGALTGLSLDHRTGFLLSCVDGGSTVEEIIDVSAMPKLEAVRVLYELLQEGVIEMTARR